MNTNKLRTKDVFTVILLSLINILVFGIGTFMYATPITILLTPVVYSLLQGVVFFVIAAKVRKKGAILIYCIIQGVVGFNLVYIIMYVLGGIVAELILHKTGYKSFVGLLISYVVIQLFASFGSTIFPYAITLNKTLQAHPNNGDLNVNIEKAGHMIQSWAVLLLIGGTILASVIGAVIGWLIMKKHILAINQTDAKMCDCQDCCCEDDKDIEQCDCKENCDSSDTKKED